MTILVTCPKCKTTYRLSDDCRGRSYECQTCHLHWTIPVDEKKSIELATGKPASRNDSTFVSTEFQIKKTTRSKKRIATGGILLMLFDFGFERYFTPWLIRIIWIICIALFFLGFVVDAAMFVTVFGTWFDSSDSLGHQTRDFAETFTAGVIAWLISIPLRVLVLLVIRVGLEFLIVIFDISETLKNE